MTETGCLKTSKTAHPSAFCISANGVSDLSGLLLLFPRVPLMETLEKQILVESTYIMLYYLPCFFPALLLSDKFKVILASS